MIKNIKLLIKTIQVKISYYLTLVKIHNVLFSYVILFILIQLLNLKFNNIVLAEETKPNFFERIVWNAFISESDSKQSTSTFPSTTIKNGNEKYPSFMVDYVQRIKLGLQYRSASMTNAERAVRLNKLIYNVICNRLAQINDISMGYTYEELKYNTGRVYFNHSLHNIWLPQTKAQALNQCHPSILIGNLNQYVLMYEKNTFVRCMAAHINTHIKITNAYIIQGKNGPDGVRNEALYKALFCNELKITPQQEKNS